ncbi:hypothetical protein IAR55_005361 [Kwoniella newhampshirensis]|uniref:G-protein coupled receptors family 1 profile domain-containing protein n=1 Tax=Kwoniella newhampshirensis TaxID=1651941 RepID=A0AAW0YZ33_9TREE
MSGLWTEVMGGLVGRDDTGMQIALADQDTRFEQDEWLVIVNIVILCFTIIGAATILLSMGYNEFVKGRPGTTRTRIVQALIICDFMLGVVGLISSSMSLSPEKRLMVHGTDACSGLGFLFVTLLWTEHLWTLTLAIATFMILIYPLHGVTLWLERRWYLLWAVVWVIAVTVAIIGYTVYGFFPTGGVCYYGDNAGLYSELIQFIPRAIVCAVISILYARLFVFLRRPDRIRTMQSNSSNGITYESVSEPDTPRRRSRFGSLLPDIFKRHQNGPAGDELNMRQLPDEPAELDGMILNGIESAKQPRRTTIDSAVQSPTAEIPPWERVELPPFQIDGERFGGPNSATATPSAPWSGWKGLGGKKRSVTGHNPPSSAPVSPPTRSHSRFGSHSSDNHPQQPSERVEPSIKSASGMQSDTPRFPTHYSPVMPTLPTEIVSSHSYSASGSASGSMSSGPSRHRRSSVLSTMVDPMSSSSPSPSQPISSGVVNPRHDWSPRYERQRLSIPTVVEGEVSTLTSQPPSVSVSRSNSAHNTPRLQPLPLSHPISPTRPRAPSESSSLRPLSPRASPRTHSVSDAEMGLSSRSGQGRDEEGDEDAWDLMKMLSEAPPGGGDDRFAPRDGEQFELVPESMASYLNRKTALLMLWFPLGYLFLFSVSLIRLIYDFAGRPPESLRAISRWLILSQGLLDAVIYGIVEWHTKRVVRKRVRKGTFSPRQSSTGNPTGSRSGNMTGMFKGLGSRFTGGGGVTSAGGGSGLVSAVGSRYPRGGSAMNSRIDREVDETEGEEGVDVEMDRDNSQKASSEDTTTTTATTTAVGSSTRAGGGSSSTAGTGDDKEKGVRFEEDELGKPIP